MRKLIGFFSLIIGIISAFSITVSASVVDGQNYNQRVEVGNVSSGFGAYWGVDSPNVQGRAHTANLLGGYVAVPTYGTWFNTALGLEKTQQYNLHGTANGGNTGVAWATLEQAQNKQDMISFTGNTNSPYRGFSQTITNRTIVPMSWIAGVTTTKMVSFYTLSRNYVGATIQGLDAADEAGVTTRIYGTGLPTSDAYGTSNYHNSSGGAKHGQDGLDFGNYRINITIPNADKYVIKYSIWYRPGSKFANQGNDFDITYYTGTGNLISVPAKYLESGGEYTITLGATKKGNIIVDLRRAVNVTESLSGKVFELVNSAGNVIETATTDVNGYAYFYNQPYGKYTIRPTTIPTNHYYSPDPVSVQLNATSVTETITLMRRTGTLRIQYNTEDNLSRNNVQFRVTNPSGTVTSHTTNSTGLITLSDVITGSYKVEQMSANSDYERVTTSQTVTVNQAATTTVTFYNPILYDFSVALSAPSNARQMQDFTITATFTNKGGKVGNNVPVSVIYDGNNLLNGTLNIPANSTVTRTFTVRTRTMGAKTITANVNPNKTLRENLMSDNSISRMVNITTSTVLSIGFINPNAEYREGTEVISTFRITNGGYNDMLPSSNLSVNLAVNYTQNSVNKNITIPAKNQVVIPENGNNLVYFKWTVPAGTAGLQFRLTATVDPENRIDVINRNNNVITVNRTIIAANNSTPPDTQFEKKMPSEFSQMSIPIQTSILSNSWAVWEWENGDFIKKTYGLQLGDSTPNIVPDANSPSRKNTSGVWSMGSGYGFTLEWSTPTRTLSGTAAPPTASYTAVQAANLFFPEFKFSNTIGSYRHLDKNGVNSFRFPGNPNAKDNARLHFVPLWFPNGDYQCQGFASDLWTPAGMLSGYYSSNVVKISGSVYDDWYVGNAR